MPRSPLGAYAFGTRSAVNRSTFFLDPHLLDKSKVNLVPCTVSKVKLILFLFSLYIMTKQTSWINHLRVAASRVFNSQKQYTPCVPMFIFVVSSSPTCWILCPYSYLLQCLFYWSRWCACYDRNALFCQISNMRKIVVMR